MLKKKNRKNTEKPAISTEDSLSKTQANSVQKRISQEKERMLSILNFDESLREKVEDMFNINLDGLPAGKEPMFFTTAVFKISDAKLATTKVEKLPDVDVTDEDKHGVHYTWMRKYPKGHWNPMSNMPGARQVIGDIQINYDNTIKLETKSKGFMTGLIYYMISTLGKDIELISLEFENPLNMFRK